MINFSIEKANPASVVNVSDRIIWCGSMVRTSDGQCHLMVSTWPLADGFDKWIVSSQIGYAIAPSPDEEYEYVDLVFTGSGNDGDWDRDMVHNPWIIEHDGKYYMYYTGTYGDGTFEGHRYHQRVGVAVADHPSGPWRRLGQPLSSLQDGYLNNLVTCNPSVCKMTDGRFIMLFRASYYENKAYKGNMFLGVAFADSPEGPFVCHDEPVLSKKGVNFAAEDPGIFAYDNKLYVIFKDMGHNFNNYLRTMMIAESTDGIDWQVIGPFSNRSIQYSDGTTKEYDFVERPFIYIENEIPKQFFTAIKPKADEDFAFNVHRNIKLN